MIPFLKKQNIIRIFLMPEMIKLLGSSKIKVIKDKSGENIPYLENNEVVLVYCNIVNNGYQEDLKAMYLFAPTKSFFQLLDISHKGFIFLKFLLF